MSKQSPFRDLSVLVLQEIEAERERQDLTWGEQNHDDDRWLSILMEEVGEAVHEMNDNGLMLWDELVQVAAVTLAWLECIDRNYGKRSSG